MSKTDKSIETESRIIVARGEGGGNGNEYGISFWGGESVFGIRYW